MTAQVTDVLKAVQSFVAKGYDREYRVKDGNLVDLELGEYRKYKRPFHAVCAVSSGGTRRFGIEWSGS